MLLCPGPRRQRLLLQGFPPLPSSAVNALVERLREELAGGANGVKDGRGQLLAARHRAERLWAVSADRPLERRPGLKGWVAYPLKRILRPFLRWYVEPLAAEQRSFNDVVLKMVDGILEEVDRGERTRAQAERTLAELEERLTRVERRGASGGTRPQTVASQPGRRSRPRLLRLRGEDARLDRRRPRAPASVRRRLPRRRPRAGRGLRPRRAPRPSPGRGHRGPRGRRRRRHGRLRERGRTRGRAGRRARVPRGAPRREPGRDLRRPGRRAPASARCSSGSWSCPRRSCVRVAC